MQTLHQVLIEHPFFAELGDSTVSTIVDCAINVSFRPGEYLCHEGGPADRVFVVRRGMVQLEVHVPGLGDRVIDTAEEGDVMGWSSLVPPYHWFFDVRAVHDVSAVALDSACLRQKCDADPVLGYAVMQRVAQVMHQRLHSTRVRLLDLYGANRVG